MGQQQLLLLILSAVIVGLAIVIGMEIFSQNSLMTTRDAVRQAVLDAAVRSQAWYRFPLRNGGGGGSFLDFDLAKINFRTPTIRGEFDVTNVVPGGFRLTGTVEGDTSWTVIVDVSADSIVLVQ
ncbi:MAG: hypothetical protein ACREOO_00420 [bacterium]